MQESHLYNCAMPEESEAKEYEKRKKKKWRVVGNVSGQKIIRYTEAYDEKSAIRQIGYKLEEEHPKVSYIRQNFIKQAKAREVPDEAKKPEEELAEA